MAARCREQFGTDLALAVGPFPAGFSEAAAPSSGGEAERPEAVGLALASADGVREKSMPLGIHPALRRLYLAKQALNFVRLTLLA